MTKHPNQQFRQLVVDVRNKTIEYPQQNHRKTHWHNYTLSKINDIKLILLFIRKSVDQVFIDEDICKIGRPSVNPKSLAKAILFCEAVGIPERQAQGWLEIMGLFLGIPEKLDDRSHILSIIFSFCRFVIVFSRSFKPSSIPSKNSI